MEMILRLFQASTFINNAGMRIRLVLIWQDIYRKVDMRMDKTVLADDMVSGLMSSFRTDNVVLFVGRKWNVVPVRPNRHY